MNLSVYLSVGKEVSEAVKNAFIEEIKKFDFVVNTDQPQESDRVAFKIHQQIDDIEVFENSIKQLLCQVPFLYLIAPQHSMERLKHHPRVHCFDVSFIQSPAKAASVLLNYAYHGNPI
jgi:hypothetical protein